MGPRHIQRDGEAQPRAAAGVLVAGLVQTGERAEGRLAQILGDAGAVVVHVDPHSIRTACKLEAYLAVSVSKCVSQEVLHGALEQARVRVAVHVRLQSDLHVDARVFWGVELSKLIQSYSVPALDLPERVSYR